MTDWKQGPRSPGPNLPPDALVVRPDELHQDDSLPLVTARTRYSPNGYAPGCDNGPVDSANYADFAPPFDQLPRSWIHLSDEIAEALDDLWSDDGGNEGTDRVEAEWDGHPPLFALIHPGVMPWLDPLDLGRLVEFYDRGRAMGLPPATCMVHLPVREEDIDLGSLDISILESSNGLDQS